MSALVAGFISGLIAASAERLMVGTYQKDKHVLNAIAMHWVGVGLVMPFIDLALPVWSEGVLVGVVLTCPFIVLATNTSRNAVIHTSLFAPIWGTAIAYACYFFS